MEFLLAIACFACFAVAGCIIPAPFEPERDTSDGGPSAAPNILSGSPAFPGPITLAATEDVELIITIEDANSDPLTVRWFRDWPTVQPSFHSQAATPLMTPEGVQKYEARFRFKWCAGVAAGPHQVDVVVSDRGFLVQDLDETYRMPLPGGRVSVRSWLVECTP